MSTSHVLQYHTLISKNWICVLRQVWELLLHCRGDPTFCACYPYSFLPLSSTPFPCGQVLILSDNSSRRECRVLPFLHGSRLPTNAGHISKCLCYSIHSFQAYMRAGLRQKLVFSFRLVTSSSVLNEYFTSTFFLICKVRK